MNTASSGMSGRHRGERAGHLVGAASRCAPRRSRSRRRRRGRRRRPRPRPRSRRPGLAATSWTGPASTDSSGSRSASASWVSGASVDRPRARRRHTRRRTRPADRARWRRSRRRCPRAAAARPARAAASSRSSRPSQRITPALANSASTVLSDAAISAPVCELAARAPADVRPALTASTGLARATRRATRPNLRGLPNDSRYSATTCVAGSCSQYWSRSLLDRSALSPSETNARQPDPAARDAVDRGRAERAALGHEADRAGGDVGARERRRQRHVGMRC